MSYRKKGEKQKLLGLDLLYLISKQERWVYDICKAINGGAKGVRNAVKYEHLWLLSRVRMMDSWCK